MAKEMVISANPHETRVAIMEEGLLCEYYVEREKEFALVGSIYKGRVTRVLPGMQSSFVDIGLDSDAFLYVTDFLEGIEELDEHRRHDRGQKIRSRRSTAASLLRRVTPRLPLSRLRRGVSAVCCRGFGRGARCAPRSPERAAHSGGTAASESARPQFAPPNRGRV